MNPYLMWTLIIIGILLFLIVVTVLIPMLVIVPEIVYKLQMVKTKPTKWARECSAVKNAENFAMWNEGIDYFKDKKDKMTELEIKNEGLHLFGEYFDFGSDKCVIVTPGRSECLYYSYFFAIPYVKAGYNVFVHDLRAHGKSDGKVNDIGAREYKDVLKWAELIHNKYGINHITLHGICIGSSTSIFAATSEDKPDYIDSMVLDGCYSTFKETFKNHMIEMHAPLVGFCCKTIMHKIRKRQGVEPEFDGPIYRIDKVNIPTLFLYSKQDTYSTPDQAEALFNKATCDKEIKWFPIGSHSHIRINQHDEYDQAILDFKNRIYK